MSVAYAEFNADELSQFLVDAGLDETIDVPRYVSSLKANGITTVDALRALDGPGLRDAGITKSMHIRVILQAAAAPSEKRARVESPPSNSMLLKPSPFDAEEAMKELDDARDAMDVNTIVRVLNGAARVHANVAAKACLVVMGVCDYGGPRSTAFGALGACELVVDVLRTWGAICENVTEACFAVGQLASRSPSNHDRFLACDACECVVDALTRWGAGSYDVAHGGCWAVCSLAENAPALRTRLLEVGAVEAVTAARRNICKAQTLDMLE